MTMITPSLHACRSTIGLQGYLIRFAPHAFAPQCQEQPRKSLSPLVFLPVSTHSTTPPGIPLSSTALKPASIS